MAIPASTVVWEEPMDPYDLVDYIIDCSPMLEEGEEISSFELVPGTESIALGLEINETGGYYSSIIDGNKIHLWLSILEAERGNIVFNNGVTLPIEVNITTNALPPRRKQRTVAVRVIQR